MQPVNSVEPHQLHFTEPTTREIAFRITDRSGALSTVIAIARNKGAERVTKIQTYAHRDNATPLDSSTIPFDTIPLATAISKGVYLQEKNRQNPEPYLVSTIGINDEFYLYTLSRFETTPTELQREEFEKTTGIVVPFFALKLLHWMKEYTPDFQHKETQEQYIADILLAALANRDVETAQHCYIVSELAARIAYELGADDEFIRHARRGGLLHDIGKLGVALQRILKKNGPLTLVERQEIHEHTTIGFFMIQSLNIFPPQVLDAILYHHERIHGKGYPTGLYGENIPLIAHVVGIADIISAKAMSRPYEGAILLETLIDIIQKESGIEFASEISEAALRVLAQESTQELLYPELSTKNPT